MEERLEEFRKTKRAKLEASGAVEVSPAEAKVVADSQRCVAIADEKVALAQRCYDLVDQHIARLDKDLKVFDAALAEREAAEAVALKKAPGAVPTPSAGVLGGPAVAVGVPAAAGTPVGVDAGAGGAGGDTPGAGVGVGVGAAGMMPLFGEGVPVDPNEPTFCICNRVSFGEMIACENESCPVEWFHFPCVGLSTDAKIKGLWYCPTCIAERRKQKKLLAKGGK